MYSYFVHAMNEISCSETVVTFGMKIFVFNNISEKKLF
jgi:hypothetical protein